MLSKVQRTQGIEYFNSLTLVACISLSPYIITRFLGGVEDGGGGEAGRRVSDGGCYGASDWLVGR